MYSLDAAEKAMNRAVMRGHRASIVLARINAAARENGTTYGRFIANLKAAGVELDRKVLADIAVNDPKAFTAIVKSVTK